MPRKRRQLDLDAPLPSPHMRDDAPAHAYVPVAPEGELDYVYAIPRRGPFDGNDEWCLQRYCSDQLSLWMRCEARACRRARACADAAIPCFHGPHQRAIQDLQAPWRPVLEQMLLEAHARPAEPRRAQRPARARGRPAPAGTRGQAPPREAARAPIK